ncbi:TPA: phage tail protein [Streptococcus suis]
MAFDVTAVLKANVSNFTSGIKEAQSVFESFQSKSNRTFENVANGFQTAGLALSAGLTAPALAGIGAVVKGYASLEQNLGGTEAVFGQFAKSVQNDAKSAYQTMGLSASDYMATANKMGSLFQGSGVEQQKALDMTSKAMKRAADVASVMGVDMNMAMESVAGAAKGNFTMMDNLGVAMNATTLEAYALEKGLNFKWETASNAEKAELAMQMFMDRTKQYDGNFLKESEKTVAGSLDAMKGAFSNFVAGLGNPEADVAQLMTNLKTTIQNFAKNVGGVVKTIWDNLPLAPWQKWVGLIAVGAGPVLLALSGIMKGIGTLKAAFQGIGAVLTNPWGLALVALVALVAGFVHAYQNSEKFRNIVNGAVSAVVAKFNELKAKAQPALDFIKNALGKFNVGAFAPLIGGIGLFIASLMKLKGVKIPNPFSKFKPTFPKIPNPFTGLANMAKAAGSAVKNAFSGLGKAIGSAFKGIGTAISTVFQGIARAISMLNPAGIASFAMGLAAVTAALVALSAVQGMVLPFLKGLADIFVQLVGGTLQAFVAALVSLAPVMTTIASALSMLSPLVVAFGMAFSMVATAVGGAIAGIVTAIAGGVAQIVTALTPIVQIISTTFVQVVTVISQAIVQIIQALAPFIPSITSMFTSIASIVSNAIVQIVQALAPFIPSITQMVTAVVSQLPNIINAFTNLASVIPPIIDSLTGALEAFGGILETVFSGAQGVIEAFGSAVSGILDSIAGVFDSIGNAALNAGKGFNQLATGISKITSLNIIDMGASLAAVAAGLVAIVASGIGSAGAGLQAAGMGMQLMGTSAQMASIAIQMLPASLSLLTAGLGTLPAMLTTAGASMTAFATSAQSSVASLMAIGATITQFASMMIMIAPASATASAGLATFNGQANAAGSAMQRLGSASTTALAQVTALGTGIMSSMAGATAAISNAGMQMSTAVRMAGTQMTVAMQASMSQVKSVVLNGMTASASAVRNGGNQMTTAIRSAGTQMVTITQSTMNQMKSAVLNGMTAIVSAVRNGGSQMVSAWKSAGQQIVASTQNTVNNMNSSLRNVGSGVNLYSNGTALMAGLKSGIDAGWAQITASVSSMAEWIKRNKGPISYDKRLLVDNGLAIMFGLNRGISSGWQEVKSNVSSMAGQLSELVQTGLDGSFDLPNMAANLMNSVTVSHNPQSAQHSIDNVASQQRLIKKFDELIDEVRRSGNTYLDGKVISRKVDRNLGQNTQLRSRTSWAT